MRCLIGWYHRFHGRQSLRSEKIIVDDCESWRAAGRALVNKVVQAKISTILQPQMTLVVGWVVSRIGLKAGDS